MTLNTQRINWVDWAKSLGIFLVVIGHVIYSPNYMYIKDLIYGFHMPFFFLISGFLYKKSRSFFTKNFQQLIIPYLSYNILALLISVFLSFINVDSLEIDIYSSLKNILLGLPEPPSYPSWFLLALFWTKLGSFILLKVRLRYSIVLSLILAIFGYVIYHYIYQEIPFFICQGLLALPFFILGYILKETNCIELLFRHKFIIIASSLVLCSIYLYSIYITRLSSNIKLATSDLLYCNLTNNPFFGIFLALTGCYLFLVFCRSLNNYTNRFIQQISIGTLVVLCIHPIIYFDIFMRVLHVFNPNIIISYLICCLIMVICYYLIIILKKRKILSLLFLGKIIKS